MLLHVTCRINAAAAGKAKEKYNKLDVDPSFFSFFFFESRVGGKKGKEERGKSCLFPSLGPFMCVMVGNTFVITEQHFRFLAIASLEVQISDFDMKLRVGGLTLFLMRSIFVWHLEVD